MIIIILDLLKYMLLWEDIKILELLKIIYAMLLAKTKETIVHYGV
jgi:hypothetical protein